MRRAASEDTDKRVSIRVPGELWTRLRVEAARRDQSTTLLINELLEERVTEIERKREGR